MKQKILGGIAVVVVLVVLGAYAFINAHQAAPAGSGLRQAIRAPGDPLYGVITKIDGNSITLLEQWPGAKANEYVVEVSPSTVLVKHQLKAQAVYQKEIHAYEANRTLPYPLAYIESPIALTDLKVGMLAEATSTKPNTTPYVASGINVNVLPK